ELGIQIEISQRYISDRKTGRVWISGIVEGEVAILVYGGAGARRSSLNEIVLSGVLKISAPLDRVGAKDLSCCIRPAIDVTGPSARIGTGVERGQALYAKTRYFIGRNFRA